MSGESADCANVVEDRSSLASICFYSDHVFEMRRRTTSVSFEGNADLAHIWCDLTMDSRAAVLRAIA